MILICYFANDIPQREAADFCARQRRRGRMICLPPPNVDLSPLAQLPVTAVLLFYRDSHDGLPELNRLRQSLGALPCVAIGNLRQTQSQWRALPGTDHELPAGLPEVEYESLLAFLREKRKLHFPRRTSLYLPDNRRRAMVMTERIAFSTIEFTLLRLLAAAQTPLPSALLCGFNVTPGDTHSPKTIPYHVQRIKEKTDAAALPPIIRYIRSAGYTLAPPYDIILPE